MKDLVLFENKVMSKKLGLKTEKIEILFNKDFNKLRRKIIKSKELVVIQGGDEKINRFAVENKKVNILLSPEKGKKNDFIHSRNSGLNQILAKLANKNKIQIGFSFNYILNSRDKKRALILGRMKQNVKICRKYKVKMRLGSFANKNFELRSADALLAFGKCIGMQDKEAKQALI
jgi:ribonuclease P/MRP protein subunit RPP1